MNSIWRSLLWKEWCESRWKLASLVAILFALPLWVLWYDSSSLAYCVQIVVRFYAFVAPIYIAAGVCASEASGGTMAFLQATPVDRMKWALAKLAMGLVTVIAPAMLLLFFTIGLYLLGMEFRTVSRQLVNVFGSFRSVGWVMMLAVVIPTSMFIWSLAVGVNRSRELWAIACSLGVCIVLWLTFSVGMKKMPAIRPLLKIASAALPGGVAIATSEASRLVPTLPIALVALVSHGGLLAWYLTQFGRSTRHTGHSPKAVVVCDPASVMICKPHKSSLSAILWMQMQEIAPLAAACVVIIFIPALLIAYLQDGSHVAETYSGRLGSLLAGMIGSFGFLFATLIGVGVFLRDLEPELNTFWRSRPISANQWFWTKYLSALAMLILALSIPAVLAISLHPNSEWNSAKNIVAVVSVIAIVPLTFSVAVATTAIVRHAIYGCILSMGIVLIPFFIVGSMSQSNWLRDSTLDGMIVAQLSVMIAVQTILIVTATLIAWLAVTRDWGWKR